MLPQWIAMMFRELLGLFVDDGPFALAIVVWLLGCGLGRTWLRHIGPAAGPFLFAGLASILLWSVVRTASRNLSGTEAKSS